MRIVRKKLDKSLAEKETTATIEEKCEYVELLENENERFATKLIYLRDLTHENNGIHKDLQEENESLRVTQQHSMKN